MPKTFPVVVTHKSDHIATTVTAPKTETIRSNRAVRSITNKTRFRIQQRINLYTRSIAVAKDPKKIALLKEKITVLTFALTTFNEVVAETVKESA
jgi:hypothetical protein